MGIEKGAKGSPSGTSYFLGVGEGEAERVGAVQEVKSGWQNAQELSKHRFFQRKEKAKHREMEGKKLPLDDWEMISIYKMRNLYLGFPGGASGKEPTCSCRRHEMWV